MFDRERALRDWRAQVLASGLTEAHLAELEDHLLTSFELAVARGESHATAFHTALASIGGIADLAHEFHKEGAMHPASKLSGLVLALAAVVGSMWLLGGHPIILLNLPPLLLVIGLSLGGLVASHGPRRLWRLLGVAAGLATATPDEQLLLQRMCRRGHRLAYASGFLSLLFGVIHALSVLEHPQMIGPGIAYALLGLVQGVLLGELGFANAEQWVTRDLPAPQPRPAA